MYLDLDYRIRSDGAFRHRILQFSKDLSALHVKAQRASSFITKYHQLLFEFIKFCQFNMALLTPHFFPSYPKDKPLNFADFPYAFHFFNFQIGGFLCVVGSRQIGKSTTYSVRQLLNAQLYPGWSSLYVAPRIQYLRTYANRLREVERSSILFKQDSKFRKNLNYKEFPNRSIIELVYVLSSDSNVRSKSCSEIILDESQDFDADLELGVFQAQSASETPVTVFGGTSTTTSSFLANKYSISSQSEWVMKCHCGFYNIPLMDHGVMDMIQPDGPSCAKCGSLLDVRKGRFYAANQNAFDMGYRGFHVPQLIVPFVVNNPLRWAQVYQLKVRGDSKKFSQEILGIPTEEGEREVTQQHLMNICTLGSSLKKLHENAMARKYMYVVSGCDWGGSDYIPALHIKKSTTVHVMMGITSTWNFEIIHIRRYSGMDYDNITDDIVRNHKRLKGDAIACDTGVGAVYNSRIRNSVPAERHFLYTYTGPSAALISEPKGDHMYNQWSLNRTESISMTYDAIRRCRIRCFAWDLAAEFLTDCLNMFRAPGESAGETGATTFLYHAHPSKPNDTLQAMNYCFMLGKIMLGEPMFADTSLQVRINSMLTTSPDYLRKNAPHVISG